MGQDFASPDRGRIEDLKNDLTLDIAPDLGCQLKSDCAEFEYCDEGVCLACQNGIQGCPSIEENIFTDAANEKRKVVYIITGDSNRENRFSHMKSYYEQQFTKLKIDVLYNAASGMRTDTWLDNSRTNASFDEAVAGSLGVDGEDTIWEFSLGTNDMAGRSVQEVQQRCKLAIDTFLMEKPKVTLVLVASPPSQSGPNSASNLDRKEVYLYLKDQYPGAYYVDTNAAMVGVQSADSGQENPFYHDAGHLSQNGARRLVNYVMGVIVPESLRPLVTLEEYAYNTTPPADVLVPIPGTVVGYFQTSSGNFTTYAPARALPAFVVEPNFQLDIYEQGDFHGAYFFDTDDKFLGKFGTDQQAGKPYRTIFVPTLAHKMALNLTIEGGSAYDQLNDQVRIEYHQGENGLLTIDELNEGLDIPFPKK